MTTAQKPEETRESLRVWQGKKHFLARNERALYRFKIAELEKKIDSERESYEGLQEAIRKIKDMSFKNAVLKGENAKLKRKISHLHTFYQEKLNEH